MADIIVAIFVNLIAALILLSGVMSASHNGVKVVLIKFLMMIAGGVGAFFITPLISNCIYGVEGASELLEGALHISKGSVNSCLFTGLFLIFYSVTICVCNIIRHFLLISLRDKRLNSLKMKRAKSINPRAEKDAKRAEWKALKEKDRGMRRWYHKLTSGFIGAITAIVVGYIIIMPYGYIANNIVSRQENKSYLVKGYEYTLNGLIGDKISDFLIHVNVEKTEEIPESSEIEGGEETPLE